MSDETILKDDDTVESVETPVVDKVEETDAAVDAASAEEVEEVELTIEEQLEAAQAETADFRDRWMRVQAEFVNARKRMDKQRLQTYQNATVDLTAKLLPAIDDFERAIENVPTEVSENSWFEGIELVQKKLVGVLENIGVQPIEAIGQPFDPNFHEAIQQEPSDEYESGMVARELQKGYQLGDRVIRPSLVTVAA
ncbi:MAG: nucleotide exchange factor GrpE [Chloroflexi bacterium]|nr:MAG: nucleotide exchange factor GrpE [Chloroflexota bacterium]